MTRRTDRLTAIDAGPTVDVRVLRLLIVAAGAAAVLVVARDMTALMVVIGALALVAAALPLSRCAWFCAAAIVVALAVGELDPWRTSIAVLSVHLLHAIGTLTMTVATRARITVRALGRLGLGFLRVQIPAQVVVWLSVLIPNVSTGVPTAPLLTALLVLVLAGVAVVVKRRMAP